MNNDNNDSSNVPIPGTRVTEDLVNRFAASLEQNGNSFDEYYGAFEPDSDTNDTSS